MSIQKEKFIGLHNHSDHSNYRLRDSINRVPAMIDYAHELGHMGIAFTEHETIGSVVQVLNYMDKKRTEEGWEDFKIILGNEIYLCSLEALHNDTDKNFYHFILLAKDEIGHKAIAKLSTMAWVENSFKNVMMRVPTDYNQLFSILEENKGHIIGATACLGGCLPKQIIRAYEEAEGKDPDYSKCIKWINIMKQKFGEGNFFLELQPSDNESQRFVNNVLIQLSEETGVDYIITTDAHYLKKEDREIHAGFLHSQDGDREVDEFYATTYIMSTEEIHEYMDQYIGSEAVSKGLNNTIKIYDMCENYDVRKDLVIPYLPDDIIEPDQKLYEKYKDKCELFEYFYNSEIQSDRRLLAEILKAIEEKPEEFDNQETYNEINTELNSIKISSEANNAAWSGYLLQTAWIVEECWKAGTWVGAARGSGGSFLLLYMLHIIQINPLRETTKTYHWRFLNPERVSALDVDIDTIGTDKPKILQRLKDKYGELRVSKVQTLLTEKAKSALLTACRGLNIDNDIGTYLASFIKAERGIQYTLSQTFYGDEENGISPDKEFVKLMTVDYPQVWKVAQYIEGLINGVGSHAGGIIITNEPLYETTALMKTNTGDIITQYDLHAAEQVSLIKWDLLAIDALGRMKSCLELLAKDGLIEGDGTSRECYEKYLGIYNIERNDIKMWEMTWNREIMSLFQMEKQSGVQAISLVKPKSVDDLAVINSVMRLMAPDEESEQPLEKFARFKNNIDLWYKEMDEYGLTKEEQKVLEKYVKVSYGICESQEKFMQIVQDPALGGFNLLWADKLRKSIAKKNPQAFNELEVEYYKNIKEKKLSYKLCDYAWRVLISMNKGYGFNSAHTLAYSLVGLQEMNLAYKYPIVYWNTANLIVDSGGLDGTGTNYGKIARAIGSMQKNDINISLVDINKSDYSFKPDVQENKIIYGLNAINGVGDGIVQAIINNRPYSSLQDFIQKMEVAKVEEGAKVGRVALISLIKSGAFDALENKPREEIMKDYILSITPKVNSLSMDNIEELKEMGVLSEEQINYELRLYKFRKYIFSPQFYSGEKTGKGDSTKFFIIEPVYAQPFFIQHFMPLLEEGKDYYYNDSAQLLAKKGSVDKVYNKLIQDFKMAILTDSTILQKLNTRRFWGQWEAFASGSISKWEMDSLSFYYHEHELSNIDFDKNNIQDFYQMPTEPLVAEMRWFKNKPYPRYELYRICGTVIDKNKDKHIVSVLTPTGVVDVKFYKGQFTYYDKQNSEIDPVTGKKTVIEKSWFTRGNKVVVTGFRRDDQFIPKKYKDSAYLHSLQLITKIDENNNIILRNDRIGEEEDGC